MDWPSFAALPHGRSSHFMRVGVPCQHPTILVVSWTAQIRSFHPPFPACWLHHAGRAAEAVSSSILDATGTRRGFLTWQLQSKDADPLIQPGFFQQL